MTKILNRVGKSRECPKCSYTLKYSWLSNLNGPLTSLYSKAGDILLVSDELMPSFGQSVCSDETFSQALIAYENWRDLTPKIEFGLRYEMRCPNCGDALTTRANLKYEDILSSRAVFLDGMTFINDKNIYRVQITIP